MARGFRVNMSVPELGEAVKKIGAYNSKVGVELENAVEESTKAIAAGERQRVPVRTGRLKKKISSRFNRKKIEGLAIARAPYAHLIEFGAKAATAKPKNAKAMRLVDKGMLDGSGGEFGITFAASAKIPSRRARPFARPAFEAEKPNLLRKIAEAVKNP